MKEGEPELGGLQVPHREKTPSTSDPGTPPEVSAAPQSPRPVSQPTQATQPSRPSVTPPALQPLPPTPPAPIIASQPTTSSDHLISQTFASDNIIKKPVATNPAFQQSSILPQPQPAVINPMSSSSGDILLSPIPSKKPKKGLIIGLIVFVSVVIISVVALLLSNNTLLDNQTESIDSLSAYKHYANFLLYGVDSGESIEDDVSWENQNMINDVIVFYDDEQKVLYADTLQSLYTEFQKIFDKIDIAMEYGDESDLIESLYENTSIGVNALSQYIKSGDIPSSTIAQTYLEYGLGGVSNLIMETYGAIDDSTNDTYKRFVAAKQLEADSIVSLYDYYLANGCIINSSLDSQCVEEYATTDTLKSLIDSTEEAINMSKSIAYYMISDTISSSNELYAILQGDSYEAE